MLTSTFPWIFNAKHLLPDPWWAAWLNQPFRRTSKSMSWSHGIQPHSFTKGMILAAVLKDVQGLVFYIWGRGWLSGTSFQMKLYHTQCKAGLRSTWEVDHNNNVCWRSWTSHQDHLKDPETTTAWLCCLVDWFHWFLFQREEQCPLGLDPLESQVEGTKEEMAEYHLCKRASSVGWRTLPAYSGWCGFHDYECCYHGWPF